MREGDRGRERKRKREGVEGGVERCMDGEYVISLPYFSNRKVIEIPFVILSVSRMRRVTTLQFLLSNIVL